MQIFNAILDNINNVICTIVGIAFSFQVIYVILFFLPARKYPKAKTCHKVGVIICAKDEEAVIGRTIKNLQKLNYPKDRYEIIVVADNCMDKTAEIARALSGAVKVRVIERFEKDVKKHNVGWALDYAFQEILTYIDNYDFFVRFDADAIVDSEFLMHMNDAFSSGAKVARAYNHASNLTQNVVSGVSGLWYIRDSRFCCQARERLGTDSILLGGGMMFSAEIIKEDGGWKCHSSGEDTEFTIWNMDRKRKVRYVSEAVVYEDQPSSIKDLYKRYIRIGKAIHKLFWTQGWKCLFKFFTTFRYCYLDMFFNLLFIPIAVLCGTWIPCYYIYSLLYNAFGAYGDPAMVITILKTIALVLVCAFIIPFILQALLVCIIDRKKIGVPFKKLIKPILAFPMFMIIYAVGIIFGVFSKGKWAKAKRNVDYHEENLGKLLGESDARAIPEPKEPEAVPCATTQENIEENVEV